MKILALETSTRQASIALATANGQEGQWLITERRMPASERTTVWLADAIDKLLSETDSRDSISKIALTIGPGSFTGLRIGVTTAKMLAFAWEIPVCGLDTLDVIAAQAATSATGTIAAALDAQRDEVFTATYETTDENNRCNKVAATGVASSAEWLQSLAGEPSVSVTGQALTKLEQQLPADTVVVDSELWTPWAATVARLAAQCDRSISPAELLPNYYRKSYAERNTS